MYPATPIANGGATKCDFVAVGVASTVFPNIQAMAEGQYLLFCANVGAFIKQGAAPTASAAAGSVYVPPNTPYFINGRYGAQLAVIQDATTGKASLTYVNL